MTQKNKKHNRDVDFSAMPQQVVEMVDFGPVISEYPRAQAIEDGVLIDARMLAQVVGFRFPVALTSTAWSACVDGPKVGTQLCEEERLVNTLRSLAVAASQSRGDSVKFTSTILDVNGDVQHVPLRAVCGPGDDGRSVITVMLPHED